MSRIHRTFVLRDDAVFERMLAFLNANRKAVKLAVTVMEADRPRSLAQNDYARAVVREIAESAWVDGKRYGADAWWEFFARQFGPCEEIELPDGSIVTRRRSTKEMSVSEFSSFIDAVRAYATDTLGIELQI